MFYKCKNKKVLRLRNALKKYLKTDTWKPSIAVEKAFQAKYTIKIHTDLRQEGTPYATFNLGRESFRQNKPN